MKKKISVVMFVGLLGSILASACGQTVKTVEVTRVVQQTEVVTKLVTQIIKINITTTPMPTFFQNTLSLSTPTPKWTPSSSETPFIMLKLPPGLQVVDENTRPNVEQIISAQYIKDYLALNYGIHPSGGVVFCGYEPMGILNNDEGFSFQLFVYMVIGEWYFHSPYITMDYMAEMPVVLSVEWQVGGYRIVGYKDAGGGFQNLANFPPAIRKIITDRDQDPKAFNQGLGSLPGALTEEANAYFAELVPTPFPN